MNETKLRKCIIGEVVSDRMQKTIKVVVREHRKHLRYKKYVPTRTFYMAHDEERSAKIGDIVQISFTRPLSKLKRWKLDRVVTRAI